MGETCDWCGEHFPNRLMLEVAGDDPHFIEPYCYICYECARKHPEIKVVSQSIDLAANFIAATTNAGFKIDQKPEKISLPQQNTGMDPAHTDRLNAELISLKDKSRKNRAGLTRFYSTVGIPAIFDINDDSYDQKG
jgi:hypothetical protein